jgi:hypothetical protein
MQGPKTEIPVYSVSRGGMYRVLEVYNAFASNGGCPVWCLPPSSLSRRCLQADRSLVNWSGQITC